MASSRLQLLRQAHSLLSQGQQHEAERIYRQLLAAGLEDVSLFCNLAVICWRQDQYADMEQLLRRSLQLAPQHADSHYNLALALAQRGANAEAITHYRRALQSATPSVAASCRWNLSKLLLRSGAYGEGWPLYETRRHKTNPLPPICMPGMPPWDGLSPLTQDLVLVGEQGLGDMIQFLRYAPLLARMVPQLSLCLPEKLHGLVQASALPIRLRTPTEVVAQHQGHWLPLLSVPGLLGVTPQRVLVDAPYLSVPEAKRQSWRQRLRQGLAPGERLIGLHWQGNPSTETNELRGRSLPLQALEPLAALPNLRFVSLQKGPGSEQMADSPLASRLVEQQAAVDACWDFLDTAAMVLACDLVISSDSALVHLAGALGAPTWLLLHHLSDWRWGEQGERSFWYPSLRLFRQQSPGDWTAVLNHVQTQLQLQQARDWLQGQRPDLAERDYRNLLHQGYSDAGMLANLAAICGAQGRFDEAEPLLQQALQQEPGHLNAWLNLGELHLQRQEWAEATRCFEQVLRLAPGQPRARQRLAQLNANQPANSADP